jgi:hypothetical protein
VRLSAPNRHYDSFARLVFCEHRVLNIVKHPLFNAEKNLSVYLPVLRMMHKLHHEPPTVVCSVTNPKPPSLCLAAYKIRLLIVLQSQPNFAKFLCGSRRDFWNSCIKDIAPKVGKQPRNLIGLRIDLCSEI